MKNTPILAGALKSHADFLLTLDKDFQKLAKGKTKCEVLTPGEFLQKYRAELRDLL